MSDSSRAGAHNGEAQGGASGPTRCIVIVPVLGRAEHFDRNSGNLRPKTTRSPEARRDEAVGLAAAIDLEIAAAEIVTVATVRPATLIGSGKVAELAEAVEETEAEVVIVDHPLTPVQQRNLEKVLNAKVLDRTGIILEIFGRRARTKEGRLQVELAHLEYQRGRLVRSWTHLERQRGGGGFMGGPGETQIEADRRLLQERIVKLKRELETVRRTRDLHRSKRQKIPFPIVAIVGYTNAGKSTLFNRLTGAQVLAEDMLFATLDPTLRRLRLPHGTFVILSDTVGFISDLPTHLIASFRATLEEVVEADLILHLRDISDPDNVAQAEEVRRILVSLDVEADNQEHVLEVWNKVDLFRQSDAAPPIPDPSSAIVISAATGEGLDRLCETIEERLSGALSPLDVTVPADRLSLVDWLYRNGDVRARSDNDDGSVTLRLQATRVIREQIAARLGPRNDV